MWLTFALCTPLFWAFVHVLDSYCVDHIFEKPWMGMATGALASTVIFLAFPFLIPFISWSDYSAIGVLSAVLAGMLIQVSQVFYFKALSYSDAGIVSAYWNLTPTLLPVFSFILLKQYLTFFQYTGILILILCSVIFCILDVNFESRWKAFGLMFLASLCQVFALLLEEITYQNADFFIGFYLIISSLIITGIFPLFFAKGRRRFLSNWNILKKSAILIVCIEILNLCALASSNRAISLGLPSLVAAVETTVPAYVFLLAGCGLILGLKIDREVLHLWIAKLALVIIMAYGIWILS